MRIIAGKYRGRVLKSFRADHIRPTTDRVKESIFNKLMGYFEEAQVLDLFAGTGKLSIEALSRGAQQVVSIESSKKSIGIIRGNMKLLDIGRELQLQQMDVLKFLAKYKGPAFDVILVDPPFTEKMAHDVMSQMPRFKGLSGDTVVVIESSSQERIDDRYPPLALWDRKEFGDKRVSFFKVEG